MSRVIISTPHHGCQSTPRIKALRGRLRGPATVDDVENAGLKRAFAVDRVPHNVVRRTEPLLESTPLDSRPLGLKARKMPGKWRCP